MGEEFGVAGEALGESSETDRQELLFLLRDDLDADTLPDPNQGSLAPSRCPKSFQIEPALQVQTAKTERGGRVRCVLLFSPVFQRRQLLLALQLPRHPDWLHEILRLRLVEGGQGREEDYHC